MLDCQLKRAIDDEFDYMDYDSMTKREKEIMDYLQKLIYERSTYEEIL